MFIILKLFLLKMNLILGLILLVLFELIKLIILFLKLDIFFYLFIANSIGGIIISISHSFLILTEIKEKRKFILIKEIYIIFIALYYLVLLILFKDRKDLLKIILILLLGFKLEFN
jgi:hypothetical protein